MLLSIPTLNLVTGLCASCFFLLELSKCRIETFGVTASYGAGLDAIEVFGVTLENRETRICRGWFSCPTSESRTVSIHFMTFSPRSLTALSSSGFVSTSISSSNFFSTSSISVFVASSNNSLPKLSSCPDNESTDSGFSSIIFCMLPSISCSFIETSFSPSAEEMFNISSLTSSSEDKPGFPGVFINSATPLTFVRSFSGSLTFRGVQRSWRTPATSRKSSFGSFDSIFLSPFSSENFSGTSLKVASLELLTSMTDE